MADLHDPDCPTCGGVGVWRERGGLSPQTLGQESIAGREHRCPTCEARAERDALRNKLAAAERTAKSLGESALRGDAERDALRAEVADRYRAAQDVERDYINALAERDALRAALRSIVRRGDDRTLTADQAYTIAKEAVRG